MELHTINSNNHVNIASKWWHESMLEIEYYEKDIDSWLMNCKINGKYCVYIPKHGIIKRVTIFFNNIEAMILFKLTWQ